MSKDSNKFDWLSDNFVEGTFPKDFPGPVYDTPDWVRHPERYPELMERMSEFGKFWSEELKKERNK